MNTKKKLQWVKNTWKINVAKRGAEISNIMRLNGGASRESFAKTFKIHNWNIYAFLNEIERIYSKWNNTHPSEQINKKTEINKYSMLLLRELGAERLNMELERTVKNSESDRQAAGQSKSKSKPKAKGNVYAQAQQIQKSSPHPTVHSTAIQ